MDNSINDFLNGGTGGAAKFDEVGDTVVGTITDAKLQQQTSLEDNTPLTWNDGSPRMQLVITLQTDQRDPEKEDDDGLRRIYAKGGQYEVASGSGSSMKDAIADALKKAKAKSIEEGATLTVAFTGEGKKKNRGHNAPKLYKAKYEAPSKAAVSTQDLFDD